MTSSGTDGYTWNARNRLVSTLSGASFQYDALGRRASKTIGGAATSYLYDGANVVQELVAGTPTASLLVGGLDEYLARTDSAGARSFLTDALGSTLALADSTGMLQTQYTYEPFGNTTLTGPATTNSFAYTGRELDATGLYFYRARYHNPTIGRFISEDPNDQGALGQDTNLYSYTQDSPTNYIDPLGLYTLKPGIPPPSPALDALLKCIEARTGIPLVVTSTSEPPPLSPHGPNDPHRRGGGLAVDLRYPTDPASVLNAAACCGAKNALDENKHPSKNATAPHLHIQLVPGPSPKNPGGDLPKNPQCKDCR